MFWTIFLRWIHRCTTLALITTAAPVLAQGGQEGRLLRFPDIHGDAIVFVSGGDLWLTSATGGTARRLTAHPGLELFPKFSPDGRWIAFTAEYDGSFNVYRMPAAGGPPVQLTFLRGGAEALENRLGVHNEVVTWTPDSQRIVFLSRRDATDAWTKRLFSVPVTGGLPEPLPLDQAGLASFDRSGARIAYNRVFRNFDGWKRYTGGLAQDIFIYNLETQRLEARIPHTDYTDTFPMWHGDAVYFTSDRGSEHRLNLYRWDMRSRAVSQLTRFTEFDVMWPSLGGDSVVFENAGYLHRFDLATGRATKLTIDLPPARDRVGRSAVAVMPYVTDFAVSPDGDRAAIAARGDVFIVDRKNGAISDRTRTPGARERGVAWSPDGRWIAFVSDAGGEDEVHVASARGEGERALIRGGTGPLYAPVWSPDGTKLAWTDGSFRLWYADILDPKPVEIDRGRREEIRHYAWSPDSRWVAYDKRADNDFSVVHIYSLASGKSTAVTDGWSNDHAPVFDPGGDYLFFLSDRDFHAVMDAHDFEFANAKTSRVHLVTLRAETPSPFLERSAGKSRSRISQPMRIDLDGMGRRILALPVAPAQVTALEASADGVYYGTEAPSGLPGERPAIHVFDWKERADRVLAEDIGPWSLSLDGATIFARAGDKYRFMAARPKAKTTEAWHDWQDLRVDWDFPAEWRQIFGEVWRQERDRFYEPGMNGVDWSAMRAKYAALLPYLANRYDLTYLLQEMIGELSISHNYVSHSGEPSDLRPSSVGLLGVDFELDRAHGLYRMKKILSSEHGPPSVRAPLSEPGVDCKAGDYLLAVNGKPLRAPRSPDELLAGTAGAITSITVNAKPTEAGARTFRVVPIADEFELRQRDWIAANRRKTEIASGGRIGYVYIPDMEETGLAAFVEQFFPQIRKQAMIIDVRYNPGGGIDQLLFERLRRVLVGMKAIRQGARFTAPDYVFHGYLATLINGYTASNGDVFAHLFGVYGLGPRIGERTWGGVRGLRDILSMVDGGYLACSERIRYDLQGRGILENRGVVPDIEVDNLPDEVARGKDAQLERAIDVLMKKIEASPPVLP